MEPNISKEWDLVNWIQFEKNIKCTAILLNISWKRLNNISYCNAWFHVIFMWKGFVLQNALFELLPRYFVIHYVSTSCGNYRNLQPQFFRKFSVKSTFYCNVNWFDEKILRGSTLLWKNEKFSRTKIFFRLINSLIIYLVNALLSQIFCQKSLRVIFCNFHTVGSEFLFFPHTVIYLQFTEKQSL